MLSFFDIVTVAAGYIVLASPVIFGYMLKLIVDDSEKKDDDLTREIQSKIGFNNIFRKYPSLLGFIDYDMYLNCPENFRCHISAVNNAELCKKIKEQSGDNEYEYLNTYFSEKYPKNYNGCVVNEKYNPRVYIVSLQLPISPFISVKQLQTNKKDRDSLTFVKNRDKHFYELLSRMYIISNFRDDCIFSDRVVIHFSEPPKYTRGGVCYDL